MKDILEFLKEINDNLDTIAADPVVAKSTIQCMISETCTLCDELSALDVQLSSASRKRGNTILGQINKGDNEQLGIARKVLRQFYTTKQREV